MAETHNHAPHDYYTPTGPSDNPDVSGYLSQDSHGDINTFMSETFEADFDYYYSSYDKSRGMEILDRLRRMNDETKAKALDWLIDNGFLHSEEVFNSAYINAMGDALYITNEEEDDDYDAEEEWPEHECVTCMEGMDELVAKGQSWSCECCGLMVGTEDDHEYCGKNIDGTIVCNHCYDGGHKVTTMITLDGNEVIFNSTCQGEGNEKRFGDGEYEITEEYVFGSEEGSAPVQDPMELGEMANWTPLDGSEGLKRKRAESKQMEECIACGNETFDENKEVCIGCGSGMNLWMAEYSGPSTLSASLSGARKTGRNGKHLTIVQRLVAKYGIDKGVKIYKHFGIKQKRASPKVRGKTRGTKSGPRRYSEGRVGGAGRSQVYQNGDRTGSWTPSGGHTTRFANSGKAWYQERGLGTPVAGPIPDTDLAGKAMGEKSRGSFVNPHGIVGYPFVPAQQRERKSKK